MSGGIWRRGKPYAFVGWECKPVQTLWKNSMEIKLKIELPCVLTILLLLRSGILSKENKSTNSQDICTIFVTALFAIAKIWKQAKCPLTGEWIKNT